MMRRMNPLFPHRRKRPRWHDSGGGCWSGRWLTLLLVVVLVLPYARCMEEETSRYDTGFMSGMLEGGFNGLAEDVLRGVLGKRDASSKFERQVTNGVPVSMNMNWTDTHWWVLSSKDLHSTAANEENSTTATAAAVAVNEGRDLEKRASTKTVYFSLNTCIQPQKNSSASNVPNGTPPQLTVYISNSTNNQSPGPDVKDAAQMVVEVDEGFGELEFTSSGAVYIGVHAPSFPNDETGGWVMDPNIANWNYELAVSTAAPLYGYRDSNFLYLVDADRTSALLVTGNMTSISWQNGGWNETVAEDDLITEKPPYNMFAQNIDIDSGFRGLGKSYCALSTHAQVRGGSISTSMTRRGLGNHPKQQFHLRELNSSSDYYAYLGRSLSNSSSASTHAGILWRPTQLPTKSDGNCQIIFDLPFCSEVAYAVPSNPTLYNITGLTDFYNGYAERWWQNFTYSLQQIQCNASSPEQYSLVRDCDDCAKAYKQWLCAVTIPRCMDYSQDLPYTVSRASNTLFYNATSSRSQLHPYFPALSAEEEDDFLAKANTSKVLPSRNKLIDEKIRPGEYREVRPCKDLCWDLVQSCPSSMGFLCPAERSAGMEMSYGDRDGEGDITCSYLGAVYFLSAATKGGVGVIGGVVAAVWMLFWAWEAAI